MPNKSKSRTNSRKSTSSTQSKAPRVETEDGFASIIVVSSSRKSTPKNSSSTRPEFLEPISPNPASPPPLPPTPWENLGMQEGEFHAMMERVRRQSAESMRQTYREAMLADLKTPSYWLNRIEILERQRERFNQKRGWSATDLALVEDIDNEISLCEDELEALYDQEDYVEYVCD